MSNQFTSRMLSLLVVALILQTPSSANEADRGIKRTDSNSPGKVAEFFRGIDEELLEVKFIPQDAWKANVLVRNNTDEFLHVQLPDAFAAVPVLAQFGNQGGQNLGDQNFGGNDGFGGGGGGGQSQGVGGGFNAGQGQGQGPGMGQAGFQAGGLMRIPPGKTRKLKATTVCLEHGKPEPNPRIEYRIIPIDQFTDDERVAKLCAQLAQGEIRQKAAQATAWHLANGLSWTRLAGINRMESRYLGHLKMFNKKDLKDAETFVASVTPSTDSDSESSIEGTSESASE